MGTVHARERARRARTVPARRRSSASSIQKVAGGHQDQRNSEEQDGGRDGLQRRPTRFSFRGGHGTSEVEGFDRSMSRSTTRCPVRAGVRERVRSSQPATTSLGGRSVSGRWIRISDRPSKMRPEGVLASKLTARTAPARSTENRTRPTKGKRGDIGAGRTAGVAVRPLVPSADPRVSVGLSTLAWRPTSNASNEGRPASARNANKRTFRARRGTR